MDASDSVDVSPATAARMPLAESVHWLLRWACDPDRLTAIWRAHRGPAYEKAVSFATMVRLVHEALLLHGGSGRRAFEKNIVDGRLDASVAAAFGKLGRLPLAISQAFLEETTAALREAVPPARLTPPAACLRGLHPVVIDGKTIKRVERRLKPLRQAAGGLVGGKALVALDGLSGLAIGMEVDPDGDGSENLLVPGLLERVRRRCPGPRLFIADRSFGNLVQAEQFTAEGDRFLTRLHSNCKFSADPERPPRISADPQGRTVIESWGTLGAEGNRKRREARRIELRRDGEAAIVLVSDLLNPDVYPATDLLETYRGRHGIEMVFHQTTDLFGLKRLIGGSPRAGMFQFGFCLLLYNVVQLLVGHVAEANDRPVARISTEKLFDDARRELIAWHVVFTPAQTEDYYATLKDQPTLMHRLSELLRGRWCPTWSKSKPQPNRRVPHRPSSRTHASVQRLLDAAREKEAPDPAKPKGKRC